MLMHLLLKRMMIPYPTAFESLAWIFLQYVAHWPSGGLLNVFFCMQALADKDETRTFAAFQTALSHAISAAEQARSSGNNDWYVLFLMYVPSLTFFRGLKVETTRGRPHWCRLSSQIN